MMEINIRRYKSAAIHVHFDDVSDPGLVYVVHDVFVMTHV